LLIFTDFQLNFLGITRSEQAAQATSIYELSTVLTAWFKFMKRIDLKLETLKKLEKVLTWKQRPIAKGLDLWCNFRKRFAAAKIEDWSFFLERISEISGAGTKDLSKRIGENQRDQRGGDEGLE
jgi:hypothetical protein